MTILNKSLWWGYMDDTGVIRIKRYTTDRAIRNCESMPFCRGIFDPFLAWDYKDAQYKIKKFLDEQELKEKNIN